jgi:hypothetical protein
MKKLLSLAYIQISSDYPIMYTIPETKQMVSSSQGEGWRSPQAAQSMPIHGVSSNCSNRYRPTYLEPGTGLRSRLKSSINTTVRIIALGRLVRGAVTLTTRLNPDERVNQFVARVGCRADTKTSALGVAPVTPFVLARRLFAVAACSKLADACFKIYEGYEPVSTMKWASNPAAASCGAKLLM